MKLPEDTCGGVKNVLAICPPTVETAHAAQDSSSLVLRFSTESQVCMRFVSPILGRDPLQGNSTVSAFLTICSNLIY